MKKTDNKQSNNLKDLLFTRIEEDKVCPRSKMWFQFRECFIWSLWVISIVIGAFAMAVSLFVLTHSQYALYEATHDNFFTFMVGALPYFWIISFALMAGAAVYNLKHTKHGYRHSVVMILASSVVLSFAGGSALQFFGMGYTVDSMLGSQMNIYMSQEKIEQKLWQSPEDGRLLGKQVLITTDPTTTITFEDSTGNRWRMNVVDLFERDRQLLASEDTVRVLGQVVNEQSRIFHACGAFPWMLQKGVSLQDMSAERQDFVKKIYGQKHLAEDRLSLLEKEVFPSATTTNRPDMGICAEIAAVRRMSATMH